MFPKICQIGPFTVYSYGVMLIIAFALSMKLASINARKHNIDPALIFNLGFYALISGIIGARALYVLQNLDYYLSDIREIIMLQHGGLSWFGGMIIGSLSGIIYLKIKKLPIFKTLDILAPYVALAQAIGRIGCLLNGCCFGSFFSIPTQAVASFLLVVIFLILRALQDKPHKAGEIFFFYLLFYSAKRFFMEFWRADNPVIFYKFTLFHIFSIAIFFVAISGLIVIKCRNIK